MLKVPCQNLQFPVAQYKADRLGSSVLPATPGSRWKIPRASTFYTTQPQALLYCFMRSGPAGGQHDLLPTNDVENYRSEFRTQLNKCGIPESQVDEKNTLDLASLKQGDIRAALEKAKSHNLHFVVLMLKRQDVPIYTSFKQLADREVGIHSVCLVKKDFYNKQGEYVHNNFVEYITNVMMKVNLKMGGINHCVANVEKYLRKEDIMVLGADVIHSGPASFSGCPSIAAIVGSVDYTTGKCLGSARLQRIEKPDEDKKIVQITDKEVREFSNSVFQSLT